VTQASNIESGFNIRCPNIESNEYGDSILEGSATI
jgi:hypothetical protein